MPCTDPAAAKCTIVEPRSGSVELGCLTPIGDASVGEPCERPNAILGDDTCASELVCANWGVEVGRVCRDMCSDEIACGDGLECLGFFESTLGVCLPSCEPFAGDCDADQNCAATTNVAGESIGFCEFAGPGSQGEDCMTVKDCGLGLACVAPLAGGVTCEVLCRTGVAGDCDEGVLCLPLLDTPGFGFCNPA